MSRRKAGSRSMVKKLTIGGLMLIAIAGTGMYLYSTKIDNKLQYQNDRSIAYGRINKKISDVSYSRNISNEDFREIVLDKYKESIKMLEDGKESYLYYETMADVMVNSYFIGAYDGYEKHKKSLNSL